MTNDFLKKSKIKGTRSYRKLHLVERFTRVAPDPIQYRITVKDDTVWSRPWTMELALVLQGNVKNQIGETGCHEGNYSHDEHAGRRPRGGGPWTAAVSPDGPSSAGHRALHPVAAIRSPTGTGGRVVPCRMRKTDYSESLLRNA